MKRSLLTRLRINLAAIRGRTVMVPPSGDGYAAFTPNEQIEEALREEGWVRWQP